MDKRGELQSTLRIEDVPTVRSMVAQKLREAIMSGTLKPGQRLIERELCEMTGVSRPSIREALRLLEADGLVNTVPHRGPVVSTISLEEAKQLYAARAVLEGICRTGMRPPARSRRRAPDRRRTHQIEGRVRRWRPDDGARSQDGVLRRADRRLPERLHRTHAQAAARPDHAVADYLDVAAEADQQEPARGHRDLARHPERRPRSRRAMLRRSYQGGGRGRAQHDRADHPHRTKRRRRTNDRIPFDQANSKSQRGDRKLP